MNRNLLLFSILFLFSCQQAHKIKEINLSDSNSVKSGRQFWKGPEDCSAFVILSKGDEGVVIDLSVKDDVLNELPGKWKSDAVEFYFDFRPIRQKKTNLYQKGVFQLIVEPGFKTHKDRITFYPESYHAFVPGSKIKTKTTREGYNVHVFMPYSGLQQAHYLPRSEFYFDISILDIDSAEDKSKLIWNGNDMNWNNPRNFAMIKWGNDGQ